eukprot:TRINITY_DN4741_c3_g1_i2.p1 TRINITY_DN4741_c3_g1~~TRINITY_DN4741_c3_g1_i2.p1  ORF type:complete len:297 (+),score=-16.69 TRINITY_DN4741_c3_g1_i2:950-1840(+)
MRRVSLMFDLILRKQYYISRKLNPTKHLIPPQTKITLYNKNQLSNLFNYHTVKISNKTNTIIKMRYFLFLSLHKSMQYKYFNKTLKHKFLGKAMCMHAYTILIQCMYIKLGSLIGTALGQGNSGENSPSQKTLDQVYTHFLSEVKNYDPKHPKTRKQINKKENQPTYEKIIILYQFCQVLRSLDWGPLLFTKKYSPSCPETADAVIYVSNAFIASINDITKLHYSKEHIYMYKQIICIFHACIAYTYAFAISMYAKTNQFIQVYSHTLSSLAYACIQQPVLIPTNDISYLQIYTFI